MDAGGTTLQASIVVVLVDSGLYWLALAGLALVTGVAPFADITLLAAGIFVGAGFVGTALGRLAVFAGVRRVGASINSAAIASRPLFATLLAVALLGESVSLTTVAGIVVLGGGLAVLSLSRGGDIDGWDRRHLAYPVVAAVFFAAGNVARRYGLELTPTTALEAVALNETAALVALLAYAAVVSDADREHLVTAPRRTYGYFTASGVLTAVALLAMFAALAHPAGRVAIVDPLVATAPLFTALFAAVLLRDVERVTVGVVAGALLVVVGAGLVAVG
jgi:drug/metabolite transporter (DMT)-like permease